MTFSKAPWYWHVEGDGSTILSQDKLIAKVFKSDTEAFDSMLIAAALDMYEAAQETMKFEWTNGIDFENAGETNAQGEKIWKQVVVMQCPFCFAHQEDGHYKSCAREALRAALSKARGEQEKPVWTVDEILQREG